MQEDKGENDNVEHEFKPLMSLRQRRHSRLFTEATPLTKLKLNLNNRNNDTTNKNIIENGPVKQSTWECPRIKGLWKRALKKARSIEDPWEKFHIDELATENVVRHRYSALRKKWVLDECQVKMEKEVSYFKHYILNFTLYYVLNFTLPQKLKFSYRLRSYIASLTLLTPYWADISVKVDKRCELDIVCFVQTYFKM